MERQTLCGFPGPPCIVHHSVATGDVPTKRKIIIFIFKMCDKTHPTNYRTISLLIVIDKIFGQNIYKRLHTYLQKQHFA